MALSEGFDGHRPFTGYLHFQQTDRSVTNCYAVSAEYRAGCFLARIKPFVCDAPKCQLLLFA